MCNEDGVWLSMFGSSYVLQLIFFDQWMKTGMNKLEWNFKYSSHGNFFSFNTYFFSSKGIKFGNYFFLKIKNVFVFPQLWLSFFKNLHTLNRKDQSLWVVLKCYSLNDNNIYYALWFFYLSTPCIPQFIFPGLSCVPPITVQNSNSDILKTVDL